MRCARCVVCASDMLIKDCLCCSHSNAHGHPCCHRSWHAYHESYYDSDHVTFRLPFPTGQKKKLSAEFVAVLHLQAGPVSVSLNYIVCDLTINNC